ncbi:MAG TPA: ABC transporter substrate-binding protein [Thermoleophilia bacterium]|nr:ABC transporter substrate-binding protein [Thermoleophilia bacterium]
MSDEQSVSRRQFLKLAGLAGMTVAAGGGLAGLLSGCGGETTTTTAAGATTTTAAGVTTSAGGATTTVASGGSQVIKIGNLTDFAIPPLVNSRKALEAVVEGVNADGGWNVGGTTYTLELISYDTKSDPNTARSAVERLISQDKANVIFGDMTASNWASETEAAKTLALVGTPLTDVYKPEYKYTFVTSKLPTEAPARLGYLPTYMGRSINKYVLIFPDDPPGQNQMKDVSNTLTALAANFESVTFAASTTDFSAVATKALSLNGECVIIGGSPVMFGQMYRALSAAGFPGFVTITAEVSLGELNTLIPLTELDGTVVGLMSWDTDTPNPVCAEVVDYYTKKYGKWDDPSFDIDTFYAFKAALLAAGSADNDKMAEALGSGLQFDGPHGASKMIPRADAGVPDRTVCLIMEYSDATLQGGEATNLKTVPLDEVENYVLTTWAASKP